MNDVDMLTVLRCKWCRTEVVVPAVKSHLPGEYYKPAKYPESWGNINSEVVCQDCKRKADAALMKTRDECMKNNGSSKKKRMGQEADIL